MKQYRIEITEAEEGGYCVSVPDLPGCHTQGETVEEALAMAKDAIHEYRMANRTELIRQAFAEGTRIVHFEASEAEL